jgi:phage terminase large subunit
MWRALVLVVGLLVASPSAEQILAWRYNGPKFVHDNFGVTLDAWQVDAMHAFDDPNIQRISLQACVGPGKTAVEAFMAWKFLACYGDRGEHPKGAATAVTQQNLDDNLWPELSKWQQRSEFLRSAFTWTKTRVFANDHPETWFLSARAWPKTASAEEQGKTLSGLHSKYVLAMVDESGAVPPTVLRAAEQTLSTRPVFGKIIQAGNPISLEGCLYAAATLLRHQWHVIRITGDPDDPKRSPRIDLEWAREQIATYGRDNPWVKSQLLGEFPPASLNALLGVEDVEAAMSRQLRPDAFEWAQKRLGVDVARYGDDRNVIFPRQGLAAFRPVVMRDSAVSVLIASRVMKAKRDWGSELEFIDATGGWGAGVTDVLRASGHRIIDVQFAAPAFDARYANRRAEIWFGMAEWIKAGGMLPRLPEMVAELTTPTYEFRNGKFLLEPKDMVKKRIGRSPDLADALALTFGLVDMPRDERLLQSMGLGRGVGKALHEGGELGGEV